jgi:hypothetical protein
VGCERLGASARLFNNNARGISSSSEVVTAVNSHGAAGGKKNGALKLDVLSLSVKSETLPELS